MVTVSVGPPLSLERPAVDRGDNAPFFIRFQQRLFDARRRAAATGWTSAMCMSPWKILGHHEFVFGLRPAGDGAEIVASVVWNISSPQLWAEAERASPR